ncbi:MAG: sensor domain-containing diguanylate cyclase [Alicyclobacillaceae bacterium]|nr:sensor domain-containing diguanylate cyclase [Alicyclobacillaceae bacterium]
MVRGAGRVVPAAIMSLAVAGSLVLSYVWLPWRREWLSFHLWTSLLVLGVSECTPIRTATSRFRFRMVGQLPLLLLYGCFPLMVGQTVLLMAGQLWRIARTGSFVVYYPRILSAYLVPLLTSVAAFECFRQPPGIALADRAPSLLTCVLVFWAASHLLYWVPGPRAVTHPWRPVRGWTVILAGIDGLLTLAVLAQQTSGVFWAGWTADLEVVSVIGVIWLYTDSSLRRAGLSELAVLVSRLAAQHTFGDLIEALFQGLRRIVAVDAAVVWTVGPDGKLHPDYVHPYNRRGERLVANVAGDWPPVAMGIGLIGFSASSREVVTVNSPKEKIVFDDWLLAADPELCALAAPIVVNDDVFAVLCLYHRAAATSYRRRERELFGLLTAHLGNLVANLWRLEQSRLQSEVDELTGLYNYRYFDRALHELIAVSELTGQPLSLLIIDIDHFKRVNDRYGHLAGNQVLCALAAELRSMVREGDIVARYGGEEFTVLLPGLGLEESRVVAERIRSRTEEMVFEVEDTLQPVDPARRPRRHRLRITLSIGVATYPDTADSALTLVRHADRAMYVGSKQRGRNRVSAYSQ